MQKKTSIDGLTVRASDRRGANGTNAQRKVKTASQQGRSVRQTMDVTKPKRRQARTMNDVVTPRQRKMRELGTMQPKEVEFGEEIGSQIIADENWSDALGALTDDEQLDELEATADEMEDEELIDEEVAQEETKKDRKARKAEKKAAKKGKKKGKKHRKLKIFGGVLGGLILVAIIVFLIWGDLIISRLTSGNSGIFDAFAALVSEGEPFKTDENGRTNVLVFGTEGFDMDGSTYDGSKHDGAQLTDSIMIVSFDQETKDVALINLPRDFRVETANGQGYKVNEVFSRNNPDGNNEEAGAQALMNEVGNIFGLDFQYYVHVNWGSVVEIVNTLGGVTVTLDEDVNDYNYTGTVIKAGEPTHLDGIQAVALARARHGTVGGDFSRGNNQQKIVEGIVQKVIDDGLGAAEAFNLVNILGDNLRTNFNMENVRYGMNFVAGFDMNNIRQVPLVDYEKNIYYVTTKTINGGSFVIPYAGEGKYDEIQAYVDRMTSSNPVTREGAKIAIFNATGEAGVAAAEQGRLEPDGFNITLLGDAVAGSCEAQYCVYMLNDEMPLTRDALAERYSIEVLNGDALPRGIVPGAVDVVIVVGQAPATEEVIEE